MEGWTYDVLDFATRAVPPALGDSIERVIDRALEQRPDLIGKVAVVREMSLGTLVDLLAARRELSRAQFQEVDTNCNCSRPRWPSPSARATARQHRRGARTGRAA